MSTPYVGFGNDTLSRLPPIKAGDEITCPICKGRHMVNGGDLLLFYRCDERSYLAGVSGRCVIGIKADAAGRIS